jgi:uroporphyrin-III C-methyltransferase / precorrin-2 dehydrogenase / sirohydrochlorin ferrochelatase
MSASSKKPSDTAPARVEPLSKLPVFLELNGQRAVVAGGTAAAAWKAELLAAAGARVDVYATDCNEEMAALLDRGASPGTVTCFARPWKADDLAGARVVLGDFATDGEARLFHTAALQAGVSVNVIDKPEFCQFQFGSIVNRSPVVIGISTDGAAPILGQAIRRRIETLLPAALASWAKLARAARAEVSARLAPGPQRRSFWERFSDKAFGAVAPAANEDLGTLVDSVAADIGEGAGRVTLVGAGPGDPELLTIKAVRAMQAADVILFDDLVSDDVLELARREAKRMLVGKRGGRDSCRQEDINELMVRLARQGKHVVRLKSGDPTVFGRAGEEIARLQALGIRVSVVPGITAGAAMAADLGISLTHRDHAHSVRYVTGHSRQGELPANLDWRGLADPETTLVFYMGGRTAPAIAARLMQAGLDGTTPAVVQEAISRPEARLMRMTLARLADREAYMFCGQPTLIGIGRAFALDSSASASGSDDANAEQREAQQVSA